MHVHAEIIEKVKQANDPPFRPTKPKDFQLGEDDEQYIELMKECWHENPHERLNFERIIKVVRKINSGKLVEYYFD